MRGLVLEGGGVKGAYHIGVLKALRETGLADFDGYVGTSIGAVNSALLCAGDWDKTLDMWDKINLHSVFDVNEDNFKNILSGRFNIELLGNVGKIVSNLGGVIDTTTDKMRAFLKNYIDEKAIRESGKDFGLVTYSVPDFSPHYLMKEDIPKGQIYDYVMASSAYPVFKWQKIEGNESKWFIDGGVYDNLPVKMLVEKGYDEIVAIRTNIKKYIGYRKVDTKGAKITYFTPSEKLDYAINFTKENVDRFMEMGYYEAKRQLLGYPSQKYCVKGAEDDVFWDFLRRLDKSAVVSVIETRHMKPHRTHDANIEDLLDVIREALGLSAKTGDQQTFIRFLEAFALYFGVPRFRYYEIEEFYNAVMAAARTKSEQTEGGINEVVKSEKGIKSELKEIFILLFSGYNNGV